MSQHDYNIANANGASVRSDLNNALASVVSQNSGASEPATMFAYMLWADTTNGLLKQRNAANSAWRVRGSLKETFVVAKTGLFTAVLSDFGQTFICTNTFTMSLQAAATLSDGWFCHARNDGSGVITIDPDASETINGVASITLNPGDDCTIWCNGSTFKTIGLPNLASDTYAGAIEIAVQSEMEAGSAVNKAVTPGRQHYHPSAAKYWAYLAESGGGYTLLASYNHTSIVDNGVGNIDLNVANDFSSSNYCPLVSVTGGNFIGLPTITNGGSYNFGIRNSTTGAVADATFFTAAFGDQ